MYGPNGYKFWANAFAQGGAGGIFADQLKAMFSGQRIGDPARLATPTSVLMLDLMGLTTGNIQARRLVHRAGDGAARLE